jgi:hypothetical protein
MTKKGIRATDALLGELHDAVARDLLKKVRTGEATAQELAAAIKFLKDNGIQGEFDDPVANEMAQEVSKMKDMLPRFEDEHED